MSVEEPLELLNIQQEDSRPMQPWIQPVQRMYETKRKRRRTGAEPMAYYCNSYEILAEVPGYSPLEAEDELHECHTLSENKDLLAIDRQDKLRWRSVHLCEFDDFLSTLKSVDKYSKTQTATSTRRQVRRMLPKVLVGDFGRKTTASIYAAAKAKVNKEEALGARHHFDRHSARNADEVEEDEELSSSKQRPFSVEQVAKDVFREHCDMLLKRCYNLEVSRRSKLPKFGDLRYQCAAFQQRGRHSSFAEDLNISMSGSKFRKEKRLREALYGTDGLFIAVHSVQGKPVQQSTPLSYDEVVKFEQTWSMVDTGAEATIVVEGTKLMNEKLKPNETFASFTQQTSHAVSKGIAFGRATTKKGRTTPLLFPNSFKIIKSNKI